MGKEVDWRIDFDYRKKLYMIVYASFSVCSLIGLLANGWKYQSYRASSQNSLSIELNS